MPPLLPGQTDPSNACLIGSSAHASRCSLNLPRAKLNSPSLSSSVALLSKPCHLPLAVTHPQPRVPPDPSCSSPFSPSPQDPSPKAVGLSHKMVIFFKGLIDFRFVCFISGFSWMRVCVPHACLPLTELVRRCRIPWSWNDRNREQPCRCWEAKRRPLPQQQCSPRLSYCPSRRLVWFSKYERVSISKHTKE